MLISICFFFKYTSTTDSYTYCHTLSRHDARPITEEEDGQRILFDRLWPRGLSKADSKIDEWIKDIAPSTTLRKWFGHEVARWEAFHDRYIEEVSESTEPLERLREMARKGRITLVYAAHDTEHNNAVVLRELLLK